MTAAVKLSAKFAQALLDGIDDPQKAGLYYLGAIQRIRDQLEQPKPKSSQVRKREARNRAKAKETRSIYEQVAERAGGNCEACGEPIRWADRAELDHQKGRGRVPQTIQNCWLIHRSCHAAKHAAHPSRLHWLGVFREHCLRHDYTNEARRVEAEIDFERAKRGGE